MALSETIVTVAVLLVVLIGAPLTLWTAWRAEQQYKVREVAYRAQLPPAKPRSRTAHTGLMIGAVVAVFALLFLAEATRLSVVQVCLMAALPVLGWRRWRSYRRQREAQNARPFGEYQ